MNKQTKPMLDFNGQIRHLKEKGVLFDFISEEAAAKYLQENNNYFKLRAYRALFQKRASGEKCGTYIDLDFAMLADLATIDMHLRYTMIQIALNTEHFLKVKLLRKTEEYGEDGYSIVSDFFNKLKSDEQNNHNAELRKVTDELSRNENNPYCGGIIRACTDGYSVWAFIEVISLGTLIKFYRFSAERFGDKDMMNDYYLMSTVRELRNAAAHNNCIINDLVNKNRKHTPDKIMISKLSSINRETRKKRLNNERMLQLCTLLYAHNKLASSSSQKAVRSLLDNLNDRMLRNSYYYKKNHIILGSYHFWLKIVDLFFPK